MGLLIFVGVFFFPPHPHHKGIVSLVVLGLEYTVVICLNRSWDSILNPHMGDACAVLPCQHAAYSKSTSVSYTPQHWATRLSQSFSAFHIPGKYSHQVFICFHHNIWWILLLAKHGFELNSASSKKEDGPGSASPTFELQCWVYFRVYFHGGCFHVYILLY